MALNNYSDLKTSVANYLGRSDLTSAIPYFITLAEIRLARQLRLRQMLEPATLPTTGGRGASSARAAALKAGLACSLLLRSPLGRFSLGATIAGFWGAGLPPPPPKSPEKKPYTPATTGGASSASSASAETASMAEMSAVSTC